MHFPNQFLLLLFHLQFSCPDWFSHYLLAAHHVGVEENLFLGAFVETHWQLVLVPDTQEPQLSGQESSDGHVLNLATLAVVEEKAVEIRFNLRL